MCELVALRLVLVAGLAGRFRLYVDLVVCVVVLVVCGVFVCLDL